MQVKLPESLIKPLIILATLPFFVIVFFLFLDVFSISPTKISPPDTGLSMGTAASMVPVAGRATLGTAVNVPGTALDQHEIAHMRYMREEEKLAHDVYTVFSGYWGGRVFSQIATAEQRHMNAVLGLLQRYGIPDPVANVGPGQFTDPNLISMYGELIQRGARSYADALAAGGLIEEVDIADLTFAVSSTSRPDIIRVYNNIHRGSRNHLRSFAGALAQLGISYQPQKLSVAEVQFILSSPMENGPAP
ncbi:MAG: DUF2202 domain-containing protein [Rhodospirillaceae bacterium]